MRLIVDNAMMNMVILGSGLLLTVGPFGVNGFAFQSQSITKSHFNLNHHVNHINTISSLSLPSTSTSSALHVKFRLDNDDEYDEYEGSNNETLFSPKNTKSQKRTMFYDDDDVDQQSPQSQNQNQYESKAPATTFGAEAVPEAQRPANEYMELLSSPLFGWANREPNGDIGLAIRLGLLYVVLFGLVCWPISGASFTMDGYELHKFFSSNVGAIGFIMVLVLRLYTGWGYVGDRLQSKEIEYEETGW